MVPADKTVHGQGPGVDPPVRITALLEDVLGCKWSWSILRAIHTGTVRPGQMERAIPGLSTKVLNERLRKLVAHGVLQKTEFPEAALHVEYGSRRSATSSCRCCSRSRRWSVSAHKAPRRSTSTQHFSDPKARFRHSRYG